MESNKVNKYIKSSSRVPKGFFEAEASGLKWLSVEGGVKVVQVYDYSDNSLVIEKVEDCGATSQKAYHFGKNLAKMHLAGASHWGYSPAKYSYFGPLSDPVLGVNGKYDGFWDYFLNGRMIPMIEIGIKRRVFNNDDLKEIAAIVDKMANKWSFLDIDKVGRVHGDLWSGNLLWGENEAVLIDPNAHGGHFEEDLAMLELFGCSFYREILQGYNEVNPIRDGVTSKEFRLRRILHNLYPIAGHVVFFGGGYLGQYRQMLGELSKI